MKSFTPQNFTVRVFGLDSISMHWDASTEPIQYYAYAIGTGTRHPDDSNLKYWQSVGTNTRAMEHITLKDGQPIYVSIYAVNAAGEQSDFVLRGPFIAKRMPLGQLDYQVKCDVVTWGRDPQGNACDGWNAGECDLMNAFFERMLPILSELYGPPSVPFTLTCVRDQRYSASAMFVPSLDEVRLGKDAHFQLITHEVVHAYRNDRLLAADLNWAYDNTLSGFEEAFAHGVSYDVMQEFQRRHPDFPLGQTRLRSTFEWDYDFHNVPELSTTEFWSSNGGTLIHWARYEMAAAAINKMQTEYPGFYAAFNREYYARLNRDPALRPSREMIIDIIETIAPTIEGCPARAWLNDQHVFDCALRLGKKLWVNTQHYPIPGGHYFALNTVQGYETYANGSEWAHGRDPNFTFHSLNGSKGYVVLRDAAGREIHRRDLQLAPVDNPPIHQGFGSDNLNLTTQPSPEPWAGGDPSKLLCGVTPFGLYSLEVVFDLDTTRVMRKLYRVMGEPLVGARGVWGGILGATAGEGGMLTLRHSAFPGEAMTVAVVDAAFHAVPAFAIPAMGDAPAHTVAGQVDFEYLDPQGNRHRTRRNIRAGGPAGNQCWLLRLEQMQRVDA